MPYTQDYKDKTRVKIIRNAYMLFIKFGFTETSIEDIMQASNLTRGAFYTYFDSKKKLYLEAIEYGTINEIVENPSTNVPSHLRELLPAFIPSTDSDERILDQLSAFVPRNQRAAPEIKAAYTSVINSILQNFSDKDRTEKLAGRGLSLKLSAMLVGAEIIRGSIDDEPLKEFVTTTCRDAIEVLIGAERRVISQEYFWETAVRMNTP